MGKGSFGSRLIGGVDEAGRGCLLGPLVVAGVSVTKDGAKALRDLGVKDSKLLSRKRREKMSVEIEALCERVHLERIPPAEIDKVVLAGRRLRRLNYLEALYFARVIDRLDAWKTTVDAADVIPRRFRDQISRNLSSPCSVRAAHRADSNVPVVSAASILAKVDRDRQVAALREKHGDFGTGYPSDPVTRAFFIDAIKKGEPLPACIRRSWKSWDRLHLEAAK